MIAEFVTLFDAGREKLKAELRKAHPGSYKDLVKHVVNLLVTDDYGCPDPERIHQIDDGDYQGTLVFVIAASGYQPNDYWSVKVGYGSCSGCDTLQAIHDYGDEAPSESQVEQYATLCLHILQGLKEL